ncbi:MarR family winged helix-turn-helix transcriptional regulator [Pseudomonas sp. Marseille-P9899]|uniref:MarR family winged helix-turn-helix transcriptional regulator n=1 Tax=Pseudomonas sp. Marseille-P9899 TaxID=2730401 RepID=UPI00211479F0|nr:MarR family transcriptional regulator [Pseudomonas sp. Marseille-P9899]
MTLTACSVFALYSTANALIRDYGEPLRRHGVTYPQLLVLIGLWGEDDLSISALSAVTLFDLGTLTPIIRRLSDAGFITVYLDPGDRRRRKVLLTDKGRALRVEAARLFDSMQGKLALEPQNVKHVLDACLHIRSRLR